MDVAYALCLLAFWVSEGQVMWRYLPSDWIEFQFPHVLELAAKDARGKPLLQKAKELSGTTPRAATLRFSDIDEALHKRWYATVVQLTLSACNTKTWQDQDGEILDEFEPPLKNAIL